MRNLSKILVAAGVIAGVVLIGFMVGWWGSKAPGPDNQPPVEGTNLSALQEPGPPAKMLPKPSPRPFQRRTNHVAGPEPFSSTDTNLIADWENKVDEILTAEGEESDKAKQMLGIFPHLPEEGQIEVAQHLANLTPDENYTPLGVLLTNSVLPEAVLDVLIADVFNRPNSLKLPLLLDVARDPQHPKATEAKEVLELFLEEDYGSDWPKWQDKMKAWLIENPD
jgi:hypothetical protein